MHDNSHILAGARWTAAEDAWLVEHYPTAAMPMMSRHLQRSPMAITQRSHQLRVYRAPRQPNDFPASLIADVRTNYASRTVKEIARRNNVRPWRVKRCAAWMGVRKCKRRRPDLVRRVRTLARRETYAEVARRCDVSRGSVAGIIRDHGRAP